MIVVGCGDVVGVCVCVVSVAAGVIVVVGV